MEEDNDMKEQDMAQRNLILKVLTGSHLYGTNTKDSDKDYIGIFIPDKDYVLGIHTCEQVELNTNPSSSGKRNTKEDTDCTLYSLPKFIKLAAQNNPNVLEVLFAPEENIVYQNEYGRRLREAASFFVSKRVEHTFLGFARSQRYKLENKQYEGSRKLLVQQYGYDVKYAYHLIRLLLEVLELWATGKITLPLRSGRNKLMKIKTGKISVITVLEEAKALEDQFYAVRDHQNILPKTANFKKLNELQIQLTEDFWKEQCKLKSSFITRTLKFLGI